MNDLIGLQYRWGARPSDGTNETDCFQLACEIRRRLGLVDISSEFAWTYEQYTAETLSRTRLIRWLLKRGERIKMARHGALALVAGGTSAALGTVVDHNLILISPGGSVISVPVSRASFHCFWVE